MSHITDVKMRVRDLDALAEACDALSGELQRDKRDFCWWSTYLGDSRDYGELDPKTFGRCAHAIKIKGTTPHNGPNGPWEIGVIPAKDGVGFMLAYDTFGSAGRALTEAFGQNLDRLRREYSAVVAQAKAKKVLGPKGFIAKRENVGNRIRVRLVKR
jgi:hypothetical protein